MEFSAWWEALIHPKDAFKKTKDRASLGLALKNIGVAGLIAGVIAGILSILLAILGTEGGMVGGVSLTIAVVYAIIIIILTPLFGIIGLLIDSGIFFLFARILGGKGNFKLQTYYICLFSAPLLIISLLQFIPLVGRIIAFLIFLYSLYPLTIALKETHGFSTKRAILTWAIPTMICLVIVGVLVGSVVLWQLGIFGAGPGGGYARPANTARGFGRIKVMEPSIKYSGSTLEFTIMNGAGQEVTNLTMSTSGSGCSVSDGPNKKLPAGEIEKVTLNCYPKSKGDDFSVEVETTYKVMVAGSKITHEETGTIKGTVEKK